ncbi:uncharacterized protein LOC122071088 [Macadamia integrifolia]|uniref:uncharacterized protein LOC122071088 n=1 Tax=Macadamia integrifolia TaxID=60698 RepID=UPI001C4F15C1|nr:uncharacterized protein LOC122071088 [Macadamia integrifolia]
MGVCPLCLKDSLLKLCPNCANVRPCACCTSSFSSSSSFSHSSSINNPKFGPGIGAVGRVSNLIDSEPAFQCSKSNNFNFIRWRLSNKDAVAPAPDLSRGRSSLWSVFKSSRKTKKSEEEKEEKPQPEQVKMRRAKSVGIYVNPTISSFSEPAGGDNKLNREELVLSESNESFRATEDN